MTKHYKLISIASSIAYLIQSTIVFAAPVDTPVNPGPSSGSSDLSSNPIVNDIAVIVNFLSAGVGIVIVGVIIMGGIQYAMAGDSPEAVNKAKQRITNALIALVAFIFMFAFVQWLVPGGIFK